MTREVETLLMVVRTKRIFTFADYVEAHPNSRSTAWRDFCKLQTDKLIKQNGLYNSDLRVPTYCLSPSALCSSVLSGQSDETKRKVFKA